MIDLKSVALGFGLGLAASAAAVLIVDRADSGSGTSAVKTDEAMEMTSSQNPFSGEPVAGAASKYPRDAERSQARPRRGDDIGDSPLVSGYQDEEYAAAGGRAQALEEKREYRAESKRIEVREERRKRELSAEEEVERSALMKQWRQLPGEQRRSVRAECERQGFRRRAIECLRLVAYAENYPVPTGEERRRRSRRDDDEMRSEDREKGE